MPTEIKQELEEIEKEVDQNIEEEEDFLSVMHKDLMELNSILPELNTSNKKELDSFVNKMESSTRRVSRGYRKTHRLIKKTLTPFKRMISLAKSEREKLLKAIEKRKKALDRIEKLSHQHKAIHRIYRREKYLNEIREVNEKISNLDRYISEAESIFSKESAIEDRLMLYASRNGALHKDVSHLDSSRDRLSNENLEKLKHSIHEKVENTDRTEKGLLSFSSHMKDFVKRFRVAIIVVAMALTSFNAIASEHNQPQQPQNLTETQIEIVQERYSNLNRFVERNTHHGEINQNTKSGVYYKNREKGNTKDDEFVVIMRLARTHRSQYKYRATLELMRALTRARVIISSQNIRELPFNEIVHPNGTIEMRIGAEFIEENLIHQSLLAEISNN